MLHLLTLTLLLFPTLAFSKLKAVNLKSDDIVLLDEIRGVAGNEKENNDKNSELANWAVEKGCETIQSLDKYLENDKIEEYTEEMKKFGQIVAQICKQKEVTNGQLIQMTDKLGPKILAQLTMLEQKIQQLTNSTNFPQKAVPLDEFGTELMELAKEMPDQMPIKQLKALKTHLPLPSDLVQMLLTKLSLMNQENSNNYKNAKESLALSDYLINAKAPVLAQRRHRRGIPSKLVKLGLILALFAIGTKTESPKIYNSLYIFRSIYSFLHYLRSNGVFEYCNEHEHLRKKCYYFYIDRIGEDNDDDQATIDCAKLWFGPPQRVPEKNSSEFAIKELNLAILKKQHLKWAKMKIKCATVEQTIGKTGEKVEAEIGKKCQEWGKTGIDQKEPKDRK
ncbi:hypothetical protein niasHT_005961 [Heterodera trifolii]|uniref:Uncharacterized protein n=1 Tax=Heterodera trifolii TaxID=157864 RepID=A0ABD2LWT9_9BILA